MRAVPMSGLIKKQKPAARSVQAICGKVNRSNVRRPTVTFKLQSVILSHKRVKASRTGIDREYGGERKQEVDGTKTEGGKKGLPVGIPSFGKHC
jgi:hypothetical protein